MMMLKDWPLEEKPREKLLQRGAASLSDAELLAIFLRTGIKGCDVVALSRGLLQHFGSLTALLNASQTQFCQVKGLGQAKFVQLQACVEMAKRFLAEPLKVGDAMTSAQQTQRFLQSELRNEPHEVFALLYLNNQHQVLQFERLFYGTIDAAAVYPRVIVEKVLQQKAAAVICAHNHPSGVAEPSLADKQLTERLQQALMLIDVRLLDHIVIAGHVCYSFAEHGDL
jgi:DNA repair protein RadC